MMALSVRRCTSSGRRTRYEEIIQLRLPPQWRGYLRLKPKIFWRFGTDTLQSPNLSKPQARKALTMDKPEHDYWAVGQSIRLCDWSTGHTVKDVAFCDTPERAKAFAQMLNEHQVAAQKLADA